jgi:hypothetical protein
VAQAMFPKFLSSRGRNGDFISRPRLPYGTDLAHNLKDLPMSSCDALCNDKKSVRESLLTRSFRRVSRSNGQLSG